MKAEIDFLQELEDRAQQQRRLVNTEMIPDWARGVGWWLAVNPWRVIVPIAVMCYLFLRILIGLPYSEFVLGLFGGFR